MSCLQADAEAFFKKTIDKANQMEVQKMAAQVQKVSSCQISGLPEHDYNHVNESLGPNLSFDSFRLSLTRLWVRLCV